MRKKKTSPYILTQLFATDYFCYYSKPIIFAAYFLPFIAYGKSRPYLDSEIDEKIQNLKENRHGNFYNYASQGFGNQAFYEPDINVEYFYQRLCDYESEKLAYFNVREDVPPNLESSVMWEQIGDVLRQKNLFLKRNVQIPDAVKEELLSNLEHGTVKMVLAKLLYYIVSEEHRLPNVNSDTFDSISQKLWLSPCLNTDLNVFMGFRKNFDEDKTELFQRLSMAKEVRMLCLDGISFFGGSARTEKEDDKRLVDVFAENGRLSAEVILSSPGCQANIDACNYQVNLPHLIRPKAELSETTISILNHMRKELSDNRILLKVTDKSIPYSLLILKFDNSNMDYIKVDLYSPFVSDNSERPSMYIFRKMTPYLFEHFEGVFNEMWKNDMYSSFTDAFSG